MFLFFSLQFLFAVFCGDIQGCFNYTIPDKVDVGYHYCGNESIILFYFYFQILFFGKAFIKLLNWMIQIFNNNFPFLFYINESLVPIRLLEFTNAIRLVVNLIVVSIINLQFYLILLF